MGGGRLVLALVLVGLVLGTGAAGQGVDVQALVDAASEGAVVDVPAGSHAGDVLLAKRVTLRGVDQQTVLRAASAQGTALTFEADGAAARFLRFDASAVAVRVAPGRTALLGPASFFNVGVGVRLDANATMLLRNDPTFPVTYDVAPDARLLFTRPGQLEAVDEGTGAGVPELTARLVDPAGRVLATFGPARGPLEVDAPFKERMRDGTLLDASGYVLVAQAAGYENASIPANALGQGPPHRFALAKRFAPVEDAAPVETAQDESVPDASAPPPGGDAPAAESDPAGLTQGAQDAGAEALEAAAVDNAATSSGGRVLVPAPPTVPPAVVTAAAVGTVTLAAAGASVLALRSERRLWKLLALFAPLYTRLTKPKLLDQATRERIHAHVAAAPGVRYRELQRALDLPNGVLAHHLQILVREGVVLERRERQAVRFLLPGAAIEEPADTGARVLAFVGANPGATGMAVSRGLGIPVSVAGYHLQRLAEEGRLRRERRGVAVRAFLVDSAARPP